MPGSDTKLFLEISVHLTGFSETELKATGMLECYYQTILANSDGTDIEFFLKNVKEILSDPNQSEENIQHVIANQLMPISCYGGLARNIIILWYTGNWGVYPVNAEAYIQGLMWKAGHTHPAGAKQPGYGSWANSPL